MGKEALFAYVVQLIINNCCSIFGSVGLTQCLPSGWSGTTRRHPTALALAAGATTVGGTTWMERRRCAAPLVRKFVFELVVVVVFPAGRRSKLQGSGLPAHSGGLAGAQ